MAWAMHARLFTCWVNCIDACSADLRCMHKQGVKQQGMWKALQCRQCTCQAWMGQEAHAQALPGLAGCSQG